MRSYLLSSILFLVLLFPEFALSQQHVGTLPPDSVTQTSVILKGWYVPPGDPSSADFSFDFGRTPLYEIPQGLLATIVTTHLSGDTVYVAYYVTGLMPNTTWHYRGYAWFGVVREEGLDVSFTTLIDSNAGGFVVPITFVDTAGYQHAYRFFGVHTNATDCLDWGIGEFELPPLPPAGAADLRFLGRPGSSSCSSGGTIIQGLAVDLRHYESQTQIDTYHVRFQPGVGIEKVIFKWPDLRNQYDGNLRMQDLFGGLIINIDMKAQTSDTIPSQLNDLLIIADGPKSLLSAWWTNFSKNNVTIAGRFNPLGTPTTAWFEWGLTNTYDHQTSTQNIGSAMTPVEFTDNIAGIIPDSLYHYRVVTQNANGRFYGVDQTLESPAVTSVEPPLLIPQGFRLYQNYPNPFNPSTVIQYYLPTSTHVILKLYNVLGQEMKTLVDREETPGVKSVKFDASGLSNGVYFYKLTADKYSAVRKMLLVK